MHLLQAQLLCYSEDQASSRVVCMKMFPGKSSVACYDPNEVRSGFSIPQKFHDLC